MKQKHTMSLPDLTDLEFYEIAIAKVQSGGDGWTIQQTDGWSFFVPANSPVAPKVGMIARVYGRGFGYRVRGLMIDGITVFYRSIADQDKLERKEQSDCDRKKRAEFKRNKGKLDLRVSRLPAQFRKRLQRFRKNCKTFRWEYEPYELFVCEMAVQLYAACPTFGKLQKFEHLPYSKQADAVPMIAESSGNQFGCAKRLAYWCIVNPDNVVQEHAAIAQITGCEECGCVH